MDILNLGGDLLNVSPLVTVVNIAVAFILSLVIAWVYKKTHRGLSYSQSFVFTLILMGTLISVVMMVIGSSIARAFTLLGAFTIIRFRTAIKDTRDMAFIFWALVTGLAVGTGNYLIALITTVLVILIVLFLSRIKFGSIRNYDYILTFSLDTTFAPSDVYQSMFGRHLKTHTLLNLNAKEDGKKLDFVFNLRFVDENDLNKFITELKGLGGIGNVNLISSKEDIEY